MRISKVRRAYCRLIELIDGGKVEFPVAQDTVTRELGLSESQSAALVRMYDSEPSGRIADKTLDLPNIADEAHRIINRARAAGVTIDAGNVIDLLADNIRPALPLATLRQLLIAAGLRSEFPLACEQVSKQS